MVGAVFALREAGAEARGVIFDLDIILPVRQAVLEKVGQLHRQLLASSSTSPVIMILGDNPAAVIWENNKNICIALDLGSSTDCTAGDPE